jgi:hypothetical protein
VSTFLLNKKLRKLLVDKIMKTSIAQTETSLPQSKINTYLPHFLMSTFLLNKKLRKLFVDKIIKTSIIAQTKISIKN